MISLDAIYKLLLDHFGELAGPAAVRPWWPIYGDDPPFEMLVGAVLVQQTRWETVEAAILRLIAAGLLAPASMAAADQSELAALIRPAAFHTQKAAGLIALSRYLCERYDGSLTAMLARPTPELRAELLALPRIGRETCDVVMLYGGAHPVFVIDEYTRRLFERIGVITGESESAGTGAKANGTLLWRARYEVVRSAVERELSDSAPATAPAALARLYAEYHAQINEACVRYCLARPRCDGPPARRVYSRQDGRESYLDRDEGCPLRLICGYYRAESKRRGATPLYGTTDRHGGG